MQGACLKHRSSAMLTLTHWAVRIIHCIYKPSEEYASDYAIMKTKVIHTLTFASSGRRQKAGHSTVLNRTLHMLPSQQGMLRIRGAFKSNTQSCLTTQHMLASTRKEEAAHLQYRSVSTPQTPTPAPKGPQRKSFQLSQIKYYQG